MQEFHGLPSAGGLLALLVVLACAVFPPAAQGAQVGVVADLTWGIPKADVDRTVGDLRESGVGWVRLNVAWSMMEPNAEGVLDAWAVEQVDHAVASARAAGLQVLMPISDGVPYWASADPAKREGSAGRTWNVLWRPVSFERYGAFAGRMATRYAPRGVHAFEVWNEPNHPRFWPSGPDAAEYVEMLRAATPAIRAADPTALVLLGGLSTSDQPYLERVYAAGGRGLFDAVAVHPYTGAVDPAWCWLQAGTSRLAQDAFCGLEEIRRTMVAAGDGARPVWLTELGWSTSSGDYGVTEARQAEFLTTAFTRAAEYPWVQAAFWYALRDQPGRDAADLEGHFGVLRADFSRKPAWAALQAAARRAADPLAPVGPAPLPVPSGPAVRLTAPLPGAVLESVLTLAASASADRGVARVDFLVDGTVVASDPSAPYSASWRVPRKLARGAHTVTARAVDASGATASATVEVLRR